MHIVQRAGRVIERTRGSLKIPEQCSETLHHNVTDVTRFNLRHLHDHPSYLPLLGLSLSCVESILLRSDGLSGSQLQSAC